jgi:hypothetical protein
VLPTTGCQVTVQQQLAKWTNRRQGQVVPLNNRVPLDPEMPARWPGPVHVCCKGPIVITGSMSRAVRPSPHLLSSRGLPIGSLSCRLLLPPAFGLGLGGRPTLGCRRLCALCTTNTCSKRSTVTINMSWLDLGRVGCTGSQRGTCTLMPSPYTSLSKHAFSNACHASVPSSTCTTPETTACTATDQHLTYTAHHTLSTTSLTALSITRPLLSACCLCLLHRQQLGPMPPPELLHLCLINNTGRATTTCRKESSGVIGN